MESEIIRELTFTQADTLQLRFPWIVKILQPDSLKQPIQEQWLKKNNNNDKKKRITRLSTDWRHNVSGLSYLKF